MAGKKIVFPNDFEKVLIGPLEVCVKAWGGGMHNVYTAFRPYKNKSSVAICRSLTFHLFQFIITEEKKLTESMDTA